ncbi:MAG: molybdate ABC transporter substrate-binding protein, partial [Gammaproteobacteria bacterium]|nr:molybdate ABC transporter substrate-binding protein [Gammaproteobacteria bacterium]
LSTAAAAETVTVAAAANVAAPLRALVERFDATTDHDVIVVTASTGQLYAQVVNGAPFDVLVAADQERPRLLVERGLADAASRFTYAEGRLALWTANTKWRETLDESTLKNADFRFVAIANPELAPYGLAAEQTLRDLGLWDTIQPKLVRGQSIGQAFAMAASGNADFALIALSQALAYEGDAAYIIIDASRHAPIDQDAVLLARAEDNAAAAAFVAFLRSDEAARIIEGFGYRRSATGP